MRLVLLLAAGTCLAQMTTPRIGLVRDLRGDLRPVYGVSGAFLLGELIEDGVLAASFTDVSGLVKKDKALLIYRHGRRVSSLDVPAGTASFNFDAGGEPNWVRFADESCLVWRNGEPGPGACPALEAPTVTDVPGTVQSIERMAGEWLAIRTDSGLWAVRTTPDRRIYRLPEVER